MVLALTRGLLFATIQWPFYAPDEVDHVEYVLLVKEHGPLVSREPIRGPLRRALANELHVWKMYQEPPTATTDLRGLWSGQVGRQPPLYYALASLAARLVPASDPTA